MIQFLKIEKDHAYFIKLKDVLLLVSDILMKRKIIKKQLDDAIDFISGKSRKFKKIYQKKWKKQVKNLDYEKAAIARDRIKALTQIQTSQKINQTNLNEADVISIHKESGKTCVQVFFLDLNKIGEIKHFFQNMMQMKM